jgi:hypothetical protein
MTENYKIISNKSYLLLFIQRLKTTAPKRVCSEDVLHQIQAVSLQLKSAHLNVKRKASITQCISSYSTYHFFYFISHVTTIQVVSHQLMYMSNVKTTCLFRKT